MHYFTPVCNFEILEGVIDWKEFLGGAIPTKGKVLSISHAYQFSVSKPEKPIDYAVQAEIFMSQWSYTDVHGPEHFMKYMPEGKPSDLHGRPIFHSHKDGRGKTIPLGEVEAEKRFDDMESHILFLAAKFDFYADDIEEWVHILQELREKHWEESHPFDKFWLEDAEELQFWLPHNAEAAVGRMIEVMEGLRRLEWNPGTTIGPGKTNDDSIKQFFDAGQGNLVNMDMSEHHENITEAERLDLLGDWEATRSVARSDRTSKGLKDPDESNRKLKPVSYEPWVPDRSGKLEIPLWLAVDIARIEGRPVPDTSWERISKGRKRARELAEMDIDPNAQVARLHCADLFDLDYHHH
eukprot:jgi/Tetstr1/423966/TSEL_014577.t1